MSQVPANLKYAKSHEWVRLEKDGTVTVGITEHAQEALGDVVFVELPKVGSQLTKGTEAGAVESVKAASDIYCPIDGEIIETNSELEDKPELVNSEPFGNGWFFRLKPNNIADIDALLTAEQYSNQLDD